MPTVITGSSLTLGADGTASMHAVSKQQISSLVPPGAVLPFAMATAPIGWLKCNGQLVSRTTYADLFLAIGTTYGAGDGTTTFQLPDLRGEFVRGLDDGRGVDSGRGIGTWQAHQSNNLAQAQMTVTNVLATDVSLPEDGNWTPWLYSGEEASNSNFAQRFRLHGRETRPRNFALLYCIKH